MNILDAINSGKPYKRRKWKMWVIGVPNKTNSFSLAFSIDDYIGWKEVVKADILATDYIIKEENK